MIVYDVLVDYQDYESWLYGLSEAQKEKAEKTGYVLKVIARESDEE